jgi:hypothetical protein
MAFEGLVSGTVGLTGAGDGVTLGRGATSGGMAAEVEGDMGDTAGFAEIGGVTAATGWTAGGIGFAI